MSEKTKCAEVFDGKKNTAVSAPARRLNTVDGLEKCKGCQVRYSPASLDKEGYCRECVVAFGIIKEVLYKKGLPVSIVEVELAKIKEGEKSKYLEYKEV